MVCATRSTFSRTDGEFTSWPILTNEIRPPSALCLEATSSRPSALTLWEAGSWPVSAPKTRVPKSAATPTKITATSRMAAGQRLIRDASQLNMVSACPA